MTQNQKDTQEEVLQEELSSEAEDMGSEAAEGQAETELEAVKKQLDESQNRLLRLQADFDNFRKRTRKEREDLLQYSSLPVTQALLPALDNLERALASAGESSSLDSLLKGVEMVYRQIVEVLEKEGLKAIPAEGQPFDPSFHQAVMQEESSDHESGIVIQEFQKGYMLKDKVIRPSMVKVSS